MGIWRDNMTRCYIVEILECGQKYGKLCTVILLFVCDIYSTDKKNWCDQGGKRYTTLDTGGLSGNSG